MGKGGRGKSGGIRAVFYYFVTGESVFLLRVYPKNEKENLSDAEKKALKRLAKAIEALG